MLRQLIASVVACALIAPVVRGETKLDTSTPKGAAGLFFKAMEEGKVDDAKAVAIGSEKQLKMLDLLVPMVSNFKALEAAAVKKWGEEGRKVLSDGNNSMDFAGELEKATVEENGDAAVIKTASNKEKEPMKLKKADGKWKVDLSSIPSDGLDDPKAATMLGAMGKIAKETADEIAADKYKTAAQAKEAMGQKILPLLLGGGLGQPGAAPATEPKK